MTFIDLPLKYHVKCKPFRSRHTGTVVLMDFVTLQVREISDADAPPAVDITDGIRVEQLRWFDGKYWMSDRSAVGDYESGRLRARLLHGAYNDDIRHKQESMFFMRSFPGEDIENFKNRVGKTVESERCREVTSDDRDQHMDRLMKKVDAELVMIEGVMHATVPEPVRVLDMQYDSLFTSTISLGMPHISRTGGRKFVFPVDRFDDHEAVIETVAALGGPSPVTQLSAEYFFGETTPISREQIDIQDLAKEWVGKDSHKLKQWTKERGMAWFDLRDAYEEIREPENDATKIDRVAHALQAYGDQCDIELFTRVAIERWHLRPIDFTPQSDGDDDFSAGFSL